jgi:hypothetical protein
MRLMFSQTHQSGAGKFPMLAFHLYHSFSCCQGLRIDTLEMAAVAIAVYVRKATAAATAAVGDHLNCQPQLSQRCSERY